MVRWNGSNYKHVFQTIYAVGNDTNTLVKIGRTQFTGKKRMETMQGNSPVQLRLLWETQAIGGYEKALHRFFYARRKHGEFFDFSGVQDVVVELQHAMKEIEAHQDDIWYKDCFGWWWD